MGVSIAETPIWLVYFLRHGFGFKDFGVKP